MALNIVSGLSPSLKNTASQSNREQRKGYQRIRKEDEVPFLGALARESTSFISDFATEIQAGYSCVVTATSKVNPIALQAFGTIACLNFPLGILAAKEAHDQALAHRKVKNLWAECTAWMKCATGALQAAAGALYLPAQALTIVLFYAASKAVLVAATVFGGISMTLFGGASLLFGISTSMDLHKEVTLRRVLNYLLSQPNVDEKVKNEQVIGYLRNKIRAEGKLEMMRFIGSKNTEAVLKEGADIKETVRLVLEGNSKAIALSAIVAISMFLGVTLSALGIVFTGGTAALIIALLGAAAGLAWVGLDFYNLVQAAKEDEEGRYDRLWLLFTTLVCSLATGATLYLSQGAILVIFCLAISIVWCATNLSSYVLLSLKSPEDLSSENASMSS